MARVSKLTRLCRESELTEDIDHDKVEQEFAQASEQVNETSQEIESASEAINESSDDIQSLENTAEILKQADESDEELSESTVSLVNESLLRLSRKYDLAHRNFSKESVCRERRPYLSLAKEAESTAGKIWDKIKAAFKWVMDKIREGYEYVKKYFSGFNLKLNKVKKDLKDLQKNPPKQTQEQDFSKNIPINRQNKIGYNKPLSLEYTPNREGFTTVSVYDLGGKDVVEESQNLLHGVEVFFTVKGDVAKKVDRIVASDLDGKNNKDLKDYNNLKLDKKPVWKKPIGGVNVIFHEVSGYYDDGDSLLADVELEDTRNDSDRKELIPIVTIEQGISIVEILEKFNSKVSSMNFDHVGMQNKLQKWIENSKRRFDGPEKIEWTPNKWFNDQVVKRVNEITNFNKAISLMDRTIVRMSAHLARVVEQSAAHYMKLRESQDA